MPTIEFRGVSRLYPGGDGLGPTDLLIPTDEFVAIVGPSGSGKSTLLRLIAGLETPDTGEILFDGQVVSALPVHARGVGMVVSTGALYDSMTAAGNIGFPLQVAGVEEQERAERVESTASRFSVRRLLDRKPRELSVGERQLVATGRATIRDTDVVLFDEALTGIDPHRRERVKSHLRNLHQEGHSVLFATNSQNEAMAMATLLVILDRGTVQQVAEPLEAYRHPANAFVAGFLGSPGMNIVAANIPERGRLQLGADTLDVPTASHLGDVLVGIRPEHVTIATPSAPFNRCLHARTINVEELGGERIIHVAFGSTDSGSIDFGLRSHDDRVPHPGEDLELAIDVGHMVFFDPETGQRLAAEATDRR